MNAKFWVYSGDESSPVKLTLRPGQELTHYHFEYTDEGWSSETNTWRFDGELVYRKWCTDGRDCDGRLSHGGSDVCELRKLSAREPYEPIDGCAGVPEWKEDEPTLTYDEYAQAAGY